VTPGANMLEHQVAVLVCTCVCVCVCVFTPAYKCVLHLVAVDGHEATFWGEVHLIFKKSLMIFWGCRGERGCLLKGDERMLVFEDSGWRGWIVMLEIRGLSDLS
jgi:hypothetical protein